MVERKCVFYYWPFFVAGCGNPYTSSLKFYGSDSKEVRITFDNHVFIPLDDEYDDPSEAFADLGEDYIREQITEQLKFMMAVFSLHSKPFDFTKFPGSTSIDNPPTLKPAQSKIEVLDKTSYLKVFYKYSDNAVFKKSLFSYQKSHKIQFFLPKSVDAFYEKGLVDIQKAFHHFPDDGISKDILRELRDDY